MMALAVNDGNSAAILPSGRHLDSWVKVNEDDFVCTQ
jgi:hypothetical protein